MGKKNLQVRSFDLSWRIPNLPKFPLPPYLLDEKLRVNCETCHNSFAFSYHLDKKRKMRIAKNPFPTPKIGERHHEVLDAQKLYDALSVLSLTNLSDQETHSQLWPDNSDYD